jgi:predicted PurR-regulated permease PerM
VAFALLAGEVTFGFVGALFAVPVVGILVALFRSAHERALRKLQG